MNTSRRLAMFAAVALMVTALADAAAGRQQSQTSSASGIIYGRAEIVEHNTRAPLRRATVTLSVESGALTARSPEPRTTATDADGAYRFDGVPAGNYRVAVEKAGFLCAVSTSGNGIVNFIAERAGALEGRLIEDTGKPIAGLVLTVERLADGSGQARAGSYSANTDDLGRFRVHTLPSGRYRASATPPSQASGARLYYPGTGKIEDAEILVVSSGQTLENLTFVFATGSLPAIAAEAMATQALDALNAPARGGRWAEITGRAIRSDAGQPIANAAVKLSTSAGALLRTAWTDGAGEYSFRRVMAGSYLVTVSADGFANPDASISRPTGGARITVADGERLKKELVLTPLSAIEGRALDEFGDPAPGVFLRVSAQAAVVNPAEARPAAVMTGVTDDRGWFRISGLLAGNYHLIALPEPFARSGPAAFPITSTPLQLVAGNDVHGVNFVLPAAKTAVISGAIVDAGGGRMSKAFVTLSPVVDGPAAGFRATGTPDANGSFVFPNVPAGTYLIEARSGAYEVGSLTITTPIAPFVLALKLLPTARGRVTFDGDAPPDIKPAMVEMIRHTLVRFQAITPSTDGMTSVGRSGVVEPDWTFQIPGLSSAGVIRTNEVMGRTLARVLVNGRDITDVPYDFQSGDVDGIEVVLTRRVGGITGAVQDDGKAAAGAAVVVFGADGDSWPYLSRTYRAVPSNDSGVFAVRGLLPGRYFAVAVRSTTPRSSPETLAALRSAATPVVVSEGADTSIKLTIVK